MAGVCLVVASVVGAVDVLGTALFHWPLPLTVELSSYLLPLIVFGALAHAQQRHEHVAVDLVTQSLPGKLQAVLRFIGLLAGLALFALLAWRSGVLFLDSFGRGETASAVYAFSVWPFKLAVFVALMVAALEFLRQIAWTLAGREWKPEPGDTKEFHE
jgi:TRAP-type C4-dicarboxylate transport system permease small subunit